MKSPLNSHISIISMFSTLKCNKIDCQLFSPPEMSALGNLTQVACRYQQASEEI